MGRPYCEAPTCHDTRTAVFVWAGWCSDGPTNVFVLPTDDATVGSRRLCAIHAHQDFNDPRWKNSVSDYRPDRTGFLNPF